jgi:tetratricopeptide (TPR) repeat protein/predicted Ser/Thr protein kinase
LEDATIALTAADSGAAATVAMDPQATQATGWSRPATQPGEPGQSKPLQPGDILAERYEILKLLGEGGMGAVYRAHDRELERTVALKVIRPELARNAQVLQRFKQELILARQVTHRNIIRIFDLGTAAGTRFITMEYIEGEDLSSVLAKRGKLPAAEAAGIVAQVARGLEAAHAEGVVHRDLKPQNIMIDPQGKVSVMDFGIARSMDASNMTRTGALLGTPTYMSPEQAQGQKVDARSDLYTLGIIFYELLTGAPPFAADNPMATLVRRIQEKAVPPIQIEPSVPQPINDIVVKMLATQAADRYQTASEILRDLDAWEAVRAGRTTQTAVPVAAPPKSDITLRIATGALVCMLAVVTWMYLHRSPGGPTASPAPVSVLVADFHNGTGDAVFDGTLEPAVGLAMEGASFVSSYSRGDAHKIAARLRPGATALDDTLAQAVARQEGINVVIAGDIEKHGGGYEIRVRALEGMTGKEIIEKSATAGSKQDVLTAASKLATPIRKKLGDKTPESTQMAAAETYGASSLEAAQSYAKAQELLWAGKVENAIQAYQRAVQLDPRMGRAYAGLAVAYRNSQRREDAEKYFQLAMQNTGRMTERERYRTFGAYYLFVRADQKAAEQFSQLIQKYPADDAGRTNLALAYFYGRNIARAIEQQQQVVNQKPENVLYRGNLALYAMYGGQFDLAIREAGEVLKRNPSDSDALVAKALSQFAQGNAADAAQTYQQLASSGSDGASIASMGLADIALYEGRNADALAILDKGIAADLAANNKSAAAIKLAAAAAAQKNRAQAVELAVRSLATYKDAAFPAARVLLDAGQEPKALAVAAELGARPEPEPQAYAKLLQGEAQLARGKPQDAIHTFEEAGKLVDTWLGHLDLAKAYLKAGMYPFASTELDTCTKRSGEAAAVFLDDVPSYRYYAAMNFYKAQAAEGLKSPDAAEFYKKFLAVKSKADPNSDPLVAEAQKRLAVLVSHP